MAWWEIVLALIALWFLAFVFMGIVMLGSVWLDRRNRTEVDAQGRRRLGEDAPPRFPARELPPKDREARG